MPVKTWFINNNLASVHQEMSETSPGADATTSPNYGWIVGTTAAGNYSKADSNVERTASTFATSPIEPDGSIDSSIGDCWRSLNTYNGTFDAGNWEFYMAVIAVTGGGAMDGNAGFRLFRSANADGTGATEITAGRLEGGTVTNLTTTQQVSSHTTTSIASFTVTNEYIFIQVGWEITGAGSMTNHDCIHRIGTTASRVISTNFTSSVTEDPMPFIGAGYYPSEG